MRGAGSTVLEWGGFFTTDYADYSLCLSEDKAVSVCVICGEL